MPGSLSHPQQDLPVRVWAVLDTQRQAPQEEVATLENHYHAGLNLGLLFLSKDGNISLSGRSWEGAAGSELHNRKHRLRHTQVPHGSLLRQAPCGKGLSPTVGPHRGGTQADPSLCFSDQGFVVSHLGKPSKGGNSKAAEAGWERRPPTTLGRGRWGGGAPGPREGPLGHIWLGGAAPALGRLPTCPSSLPRAQHPSSNHTGAR